VKQVASKAGLLLSLFFDHEDIGNIFFRNVGLLSPDYTALYPRRYLLTSTALHFEEAISSALKSHNYHSQ
jgi:hypothetical protein